MTILFSVKQLENGTRQATLTMADRSYIIYHAERILSALAKFLVHLFGEGKMWAEMGVGRGMGLRKSGGKEKGRKMGMHEK